MLSFACPGCGKQLKVQDELTGRKVKCHGCGRIMTVPLRVTARGDPADAEPAKKSGKKKRRTTLTRVFAAVFGAVLAQVLVAVLVKWADPGLWRSQPASQGAPPPPPPGTEVAPARPSTFTALPGGQALFNGKDLTGWVTADGKPGNWRVQDGLLTCFGPKAFLYAVADDWGDCHIRVEAKVNQDGGGGVLFRVNRPWKAGEGYHSHIGNFTVPRQKTGGLGNFVGALVDESPVLPDSWFTLDVIARDRHVQVQVDGKSVVDYTDVKNNRLSGHIALQHLSPQTRVFFRHVEAQRLIP